MSDHQRHRHTQKAIHHESRRLTLRAPRVQVGGGVKDGFTWYHIADSERANDWNIALGMGGPVLTTFRNVFTVADWGTLSSSQKLDLYIQLIERQDEMFRMALNIIYAKLGINPQSDTLLDDVIATLGTIESLGEDRLKAYIMDVFSLITGVRPGSQEMATVLKLEELDIYGEKLARLIKDPLPQILLWPERVSNVFVEYIARGLIELKTSHTELDDVLAERDPAVKKTKQEAFATAHNAHIQANAVLTTSLGLRDGFFLWQKMAYPDAPMDTCPKDQRSPCGQTGVADISFWFQFCNKMKTSIADDTAYFKKTAKIGILFSHLVAYVYKIYTESGIGAARTAILNLSNFASGADQLTKDSTYRPRDITVGLIDRFNALRVLEPAQYTFLLHLVYTMGVLEREGGAASAASAAQEDSSNSNTEVSPVPINRSSRTTARRGRSAVGGIGVPRRSIRIAAQK